MSDWYEDGLALAIDEGRINDWILEFYVENRFELEEGVMIIADLDGKDNIFRLEVSATSINMFFCIRTLLNGEEIMFTTDDLTEDSILVVFNEVIETFLDLVNL